MNTFTKEEEALLQRCGVLHGHIGTGVLMGFQASLYAKELLDLDSAGHHDVVCIAEDTFCGVDAVQVVLGCTAGIGNLIFRMRGKKVLTVFNCKNGKGVRLAFKPLPEMSNEDMAEYIKNTPRAELFNVSEPKVKLPDQEKTYEPIPCDCCGELTAENMIRIDNGKKLCLDCYKPCER